MDAPGMPMAGRLDCKGGMDIVTVARPFEPSAEPRTADAINQSVPI